VPTTRRFPFAREVREINRLEPELAAVPDSDLKRRSRSLQYRVRSGEPPWMARRRRTHPGSPPLLVCEAFALVREAARRTVGQRHFDVQLAGGLAMVRGGPGWMRRRGRNRRGGVAEMQTGEGKTLTATLPLYLHALQGRGAHLITANDYLARRDAEWMRPVFERLGLSVGVLQADSTPAGRRAAYRCDVTYGTIREFGFDFLRDRLRQKSRVEGRESRAGIPLTLSPQPLASTLDSGLSTPLQRAPYFALVDEADNILIDEARTPLIISAEQSAGRGPRDALFRWAAATTALAGDVDFTLDVETRTAELTQRGRRTVRELPRNGIPTNANLLDLFEAAERAVVAQVLFRRDREYLVREDEIVLIDASTGRPAEGRKLRRGLHQAIEAKEGVPITAETSAAAQVTVQLLIRRYRHLAGMTGTAADAAAELRRFYRLRVHRIPTNRPLRRRRLPTVVLADESEKWDRVLREVAELKAAGRPVLIGTRSVRNSDELSRRLSDAGIEHQVLNARELAKEAAIVAHAGRAGSVTVATNMAGRGTDIQLDETARAAGGLHVLSTEKHDAERIDRQLLGRCGRQGDPGTFQEILSLDDGILQEGLTPSELRRLEHCRRTRGIQKAAGFFRRAQRRLKRRHYAQRKLLMYAEQQRMQRDRELGLDYFLEVSE
jgi:preprotein translocase subunit SecA